MFIPIWAVVVVIALAWVIYLYRELVADCLVAAGFVLAILGLMALPVLGSWLLSLV